MIAIMGPRDAAPCMPGQQQAALLHQPVDAFGVDGIVGRSPLALEQRGDPPVSIARAVIHQAPDIGRELRHPRRGSWGAAIRTLAACSLKQVGTGHPEGLCDPFHEESSGACDRDSKVVFLPVQSQEPP